MTSQYLLSHARTALKFGLQSLGLESGDQVLIPDYICEVILHPLRQLGLKHRFYPVQDNLSPDWEELENQVTPGSKALLMVHYFGQPQDIPRFQKFCKRHGLRLIEDNAHGHGGQWEGQFLGTFGDIGISSPRKSLELPSGGMLFLNGATTPLSLEQVADGPPFSVDLWKEQVKRIVKQNRRLIAWGRKHFRPRPPYWNPKAFREPEIPDWQMDSFSERLLKQADLATIRSQRQAVYRTWETFVLKSGLAPVFTDLAPDASPLGVPAYTEGAEASPRWFDWGWKHGFNVHSWPTLPASIVEEKGLALQRWQRLVCFPIESGMQDQWLQQRLKRLVSP